MCIRDSCKSDSEPTERCQDCQREKRPGRRSRIIVLVRRKERRNRVSIVQLFHRRLRRGRQHDISNQFPFVWRRGHDLRKWERSSDGTCEFAEGCRFWQRRGETRNFPLQLARSRKHAQDIQRTDRQSSFRNESWHLEYGLSLIHIPSPRDATLSRMPSSA